MKTVAILQSNYIPWKGYFDLIKSVDEFILYDDVQYSKGDFRNRNRLKSKNGLKWLTIPVQLSGVWPINIDQVHVSDNNWAQKHWDFIKQSFNGADNFKEASAFLEPLYKNISDQNLSTINAHFIRAISGYLNIDTDITTVNEYFLENCDKNHRVLELCKKAGANIYISGPAGSNYLDHNLFSENGIVIQYFDYDGFPKYPQLHGDFVHQVSIIDLIFNMGEKSHQYLLRKKN